MGVDPQTLARDQLRAQFRQLALGEIGVLVEEIFREDELKDRVSQEFQALIVEVVALRLMPEARMSQRFRQEERIAKLVPQSLFERIHERRGLCSTSPKRVPANVLGRKTDARLRVGMRLSDSASAVCKIHLEFRVVCP